MLLFDCIADDKRHIFCDASNIIIGLQKDPSTGRQDDNVKLSPSKLLQLVSGGLLNVDEAIVAGSFAKHPDTPLWDKWRDSAWDVRLLQLVGGKEQAVDDILQSPLFATLASSYKEPRTLVLLTGDGNDNDGRTTFPLAVETALRQNILDIRHPRWKVELYI